MAHSSRFSARRGRSTLGVALSVAMAWATIAGVAITWIATAWTAPADQDARRARAERTRDLKFAAEMAEQGLWREALFRWERLLRSDPENPLLLNNVAVAKEALGDRSGARAAYAAAVAHSTDPKLLANHQLFLGGEPKPKENQPAADPADPSGSQP